MSGQLKWDHSQAASAVSSLGAAKSDISGDSVKSPTGCGWSASSASKVVSKPPVPIVQHSIKHSDDIHEPVDSRQEYGGG